MNNMQLERKLKSESEKYAPDVYDNVMAAARTEGLLEAEEKTVEVELNGGSTLRAKNKMKLTITIASVCAVFLACVIAIISVIATKLPFSKIPATNNITLSANNAYGLGAVSTVKLLGDNVSVNSLRRLSAVRAVAVADKSTESDVRNQIEKFNEYFTALDDFLNDELVTTSVTVNTDSQIPYETKMTIKGTELNGIQVEYVMYYTESLKIHESSYRKNETEYTLEGVMLLYGREYYLTGERKEETDDDETENKLRIRAYADRSDTGTYVEMEQEQSEEADEKEVEYVYSVYENKKLIEKTAVEFETEVKNGKEETEYVLEFRSGESRGKYKVERDVKDDTKIKVSYNLDDSKGEFVIIMTADGNYEYKFSDGTSKILNKK